MSAQSKRPTMRSTVPRRSASCVRASPGSWQIPVATSIWERRNSGPTELPEGRVALLHHLGPRVDDEIAGGEVDQEVFLLDAEREAGF